jgi:hypothetical protein
MGNCIGLEVTGQRLVITECGPGLRVLEESGFFLNKRMADLRFYPQVAQNSPRIIDFSFQPAIR